VLARRPTYAGQGTAVCITSTEGMKPEPAPSEIEASAFRGESNEVLVVQTVEELGGALHIFYKKLPCELNRQVRCGKLFCWDLGGPQGHRSTRSSR